MGRRARNRQRWWSWQRCCARGRAHSGERAQPDKAFADGSANGECSAEPRRSHMNMKTLHRVPYGSLIRVHWCSFLVSSASFRLRPFRPLRFFRLLLCDYPPCKRKRAGFQSSPTRNNKIFLEMRRRRLAPCYTHMRTTAICISTDVERVAPVLSPASRQIWLQVGHAVVAGVGLVWVGPATAGWEAAGQRPPATRGVSCRIGLVRSPDEVPDGGH